MFVPHQVKLGEELMPSPPAAHRAADGPEVLAEPMDQSPMVCAGPDSHPRLNPATEFMERSHEGQSTFEARSVSTSIEKAKLGFFMLFCGKIELFEAIGTMVTLHFFSSEGNGRTTF